MSLFIIAALLLNVTGGLCISIALWIGWLEVRAISKVDEV
jgi:hypothetical protein